MSIIKKIFYVIPLLFFMSIIIIASSMPYGQQDLRPYLQSLPLEWINDVFGSWSFSYSSGEVSVEQKGAAGFIEFFIRKGSHFLVYFALSAFSFTALFPYRFTLFFKWTISLLFVLCFAVTDEVRHYYNPDRTGLWQDVILDMAGALSALFVILCVQKYRKQKAMKTKSHE